MRLCGYYCRFQLFSLLGRSWPHRPSVSPPLCVATWCALHHLKKPQLSGKCHRVLFLGDDIKVGRQGRLQVMLLDETIFTLGANSVMRIDEFVYDPSNAKNSLSTSIKQGAFRFVSGQIAKRDANAMTVRLPSATIGVRGTSVAGDVDEDGSAQVILLGPAADNSLGLPAGAINIANQAGVVDITRPGFVTEIAAALVPPARTAATSHTGANPPA